jgi:hypothetical protein
MNAQRVSILLALLVLAASARPAPAAAKPPALSAADEQYLERPLKELLFDPTGAERVEFWTLIRTVWAKAEVRETEGWLVAGKKGEPGRIYFADGASISAEDVTDLKKVGFRAACLANAGARRGRASERVADAAGLNLNVLLLGAPRTHPLFKDSEARLEAMKATLDRYLGTYRQANPWLAHRLGAPPFGRPPFIPDIRPLGRAATADDVKAGKAVFHLDGQGQPAALELPAIAKLQRPKREPVPVLIVQAETGPGGKTTYGVIALDEIRAVSGRELTEIKTLADLTKEEAAAAKTKI